MAKGGKGIKRRRTVAVTWWGNGVRAKWPNHVPLPRLPDDVGNYFSYGLGRWEEAPSTHNTHIQCIFQSVRPIGGHNYFIKSLRWPKKGGWGEVSLCGAGKYQHSTPEDLEAYVRGPYTEGDKHKAAITAGEIAFEFGKFDPEADKDILGYSLQEVIESLKVIDDWDDVAEDPRTLSRYYTKPDWCKEMWEKHHPQVYEVGIPDVAKRPWMSELGDSLGSGPVNRRIHWVWSDSSVRYKSTFMEWCSSQAPEGVISLTTWKDPKYIFAMVTRKTRIIWFDCPRENTLEERNALIKILEQVSNHGWKLPQHYNLKKVLVKCHIVVTANWVPTTEQLPKRLHEYYVEKVPHIFTDHTL